MTMGDLVKINCPESSLNNFTGLVVGAWVNSALKKRIKVLVFMSGASFSFAPGELVLVSLGDTKK